ncbi:hypothetical protein [Acinetobacter baumannii]
MSFSRTEQVTTQKFIKDYGILGEKTSEKIEIIYTVVEVTILDKQKKLATINYSISTNDALTPSTRMLDFIYINDSDLLLEAESALKNSLHN